MNKTLADKFDDAAKLIYELRQVTFSQLDTIGSLQQQVADAQFHARTMTQERDAARAVWSSDAQAIAGATIDRLAKERDELIKERDELKALNSRLTDRSRDVIDTCLEQYQKDGLRIRQLRRRWKRKGE